MSNYEKDMACVGTSQDKSQYRGGTNQQEGGLAKSCVYPTSAGISAKEPTLADRVSYLEQGAVSLRDELRDVREIAQAAHKRLEHLASLIGYIV